MVVIVVIAILAAITVVTYSNVQERARDSSRAQAAQQLQTALEMYRLDHGEYPNACFNSDDTHKIPGTPASDISCPHTFLEDVLAPGYLSALPETDGILYASYHPRVGGGRLDFYALLLRYESKDQCRILAGNEPNDRWFSGAADC